MRVLSIGSDRSKRGVLYPGTPASARQRAYAENLGSMDIIGFSRRGEAQRYTDGPLAVYPTDSMGRRWYRRDAMRIAHSLEKPDVVTTQDPFEGGLTALRVARYFGVPLHVQVHADFLSPQYGSWPLNVIRRLIARYVLRRASRVRVVSERIKRSLIEKYGITAPIAVLPIYTDIERLRSALPDPEYREKTASFASRLLVVARLEPEKNVSLAIRAFAQTPADYCLIVVGDGSQRPHLEAEARDLGVHERVFFAGETDAAAFYPLADLVLVPSRFEGYGLVIVEALARGISVLSTDVGIAREAGALIATEQGYAGALKEWTERGPREGTLLHYPYTSFSQYVQAYCDDIRSCAAHQ